MLENRLVKTALGVVARMPVRRRATWDLLAHIRALLEPVTPVHVHAGYVPAVLYSRLNESYRPAIELARLILRLCGLEAGHGSQQAPALLIRMNRLYEDFVTAALAEACRPLELHVGALDRSRSLDREGGITLVPDLTFSAQGRVVLVGDAKYKRLDVSGLPNADIYQAVAYAVGFEVPAAALIYPAAEAHAATHSIAAISKRVLVRTLDLSLEPDALLEQVAALAAELEAVGAARPARSVIDIISMLDAQWSGRPC